VFDPELLGDDDGGAGRRQPDDVVVASPPTHEGERQGKRHGESLHRDLLCVQPV